jgi:hypothetical protein
MVYAADLARDAQTIRSQGWGYIYGTAGELWTRAKQDKLIEEKAGNKNYYMSAKYGGRWIGRYVADCSGLIVYIGKKHGLSLPHGSNSLYKKGYLSQKGLITSALPAGALVFKLRNGDDFYHVGIHTGDGRVVEAQASRTGVVQSDISTWTHYGLLNGVSYGAENEVIPLGVGKAIVDVPNDGTLWVREKPSRSGKQIDAVREGDTVEVLAISGDWAKIRYCKEGYAMAKYLKEVQG